MSLITEISNLATRIATDVKSIRTLVNGNTADLSALNTTTKTNLVAALNELKASLDAVSGGAAGIDDGLETTSTTWSSTKIAAEVDAAIAALVGGSPTALDTLDELAAALSDDANFAATVTTALGQRVRVDAAQTFTGPEQTQARANIGAAATTHGHTASQITDSTATGRSVVTATDAAAARSAIGAGTGSSNLVIGTTAGTAADAGALATSLAGKANTSHTQPVSTISDSTAVGRAVVTAADAPAARTAIGAASAADVGDTTTDFVAIFEAGLV